MAALVPFEHVVSGGTPNLYLIEDTKSLIQIAAATDILKDIKSILPRKPSIRSTFDVYLRENMLIYFKEPCGAEDMQELFFVHVVPADENDLPDHRKQYGFGGFNFRFRDYDLSLDKGCVALHKLPNYAIARIRTGQFLVNEDGSTEHLWEGEIRFDE